MPGVRPEAVDNASSVVQNERIRAGPNPIRFAPTVPDLVPFQGSQGHTEENGFIVK